MGGGGGGPQKKKRQFFLSECPAIAYTGERIKKAVGVTTSCNERQISCRMRWAISLVYYEFYTDNSLYQCMDSMSI